MSGRGHAGALVAAGLGLVTLLGALRDSRGAAAQRQGVRVGDPAPVLRASDVEGHRIPWETDGASARAASVVLFHAPETTYADAALQGLLGALADLELPREELRLVVVVDAPAALPALERAWTARGIAGLAAVDPSREDAAAYGVVVFPTAVVLDRAHVVRAVVKGYSALFAHRVALGVRLAVGELTPESHAQALRGAGGSSADAGAARQLRLARRLVRGGRAAQAEALLESLVDDPPSRADALVLLGRLALADGRLEDARAWSARLEALTGVAESAAARVLRARLALASGDLEGARRLAAELDPASPERAFLEGGLRERAGDPATAARTYRAALDALLLRAAAQEP